MNSSGLAEGAQGKKSSSTGAVRSQALFPVQVGPAAKRVWIRLGKIEDGEDKA